MTANRTFAAAFAAFALFASVAGAANAASGETVKAKAGVDMITTQSLPVATDGACAMQDARLCKTGAAAKDRFPVNALEGMNLGL
jgi:hypothetical protein